MQDPATTFPSLQLYGKPVNWDRIKRFNRKSKLRRARQSGPLIEQRIQLRLHLGRPQMTIWADERIILLTKAYLDWNVSAWSPLGFGVRDGEAGLGQGQHLPRMFKKCFYDAIPLLLTKHTPRRSKKSTLPVALLHNASKAAHTGSSFAYYVCTHTHYGHSLRISEVI